MTAREERTVHEERIASELRDAARVDDRLDEIRRALTAWDAELNRILKNESKKKTATVLPMPSR